MKRPRSRLATVTAVIILAMSLSPAVPAHAQAPPEEPRSGHVTVTVTITPRNPPPTPPTALPDTGSNLADFLLWLPIGLLLTGTTATLCTHRPHAHPKDDLTVNPFVPTVRVDDSCDPVG